MSKEAPKHTKQDLEYLFKLYLQKRLASQTNFYETRVRENELNSNFTFTAATLVMTLSSLFATWGASDPGGSKRWMVVASAVLPAFAALLAGFRQLYGWDRQVAIYRSAKLGLERASLIVPDNDLIAESDIAQVYPCLIASTELVLTNEVNQWGQFLLDKEKQNEQEVARIEVVDSTTQREQVRAYSQTAEMAAVQAGQEAEVSSEPTAYTGAPAVTVSEATADANASSSTNGSAPAPAPLPADGEAAG